MTFPPDVQGGVVGDMSSWDRPQNAEGPDGGPQAAHRDGDQDQDQERDDAPVLAWKDDPEPEGAQGHEDAGGDGRADQATPGVVMGNRANQVNAPVSPLDSLQWGGPTEEVPAVPNIPVTQGAAPPGLVPDDDATVEADAFDTSSGDGVPLAPTTSMPWQPGPPPAPSNPGMSAQPGRYEPPYPSPYPGMPNTSPTSSVPPGAGGPGPSGPPVKVLSVVAAMAVLVLIVSVVVTRDGGSGDGDDGSSEPGGQAPGEVVDLADGDGLIVGSTGVIGAWSDGQWQARGDGDQPGAGLDFSVVGAGGDVSSAPGEAVDEECAAQQATSGQDVQVPLEGSPPPVAVAGVDDPRPREVEYFESSETYTQAAAEVARGQGATTPPTVTQVLRTDIDGDGTLEVVVAAEHLSDPDGLTPASGDWSMVFVRRVVGDGATADLVAGSLAGGEGQSLERIQVSTVADLNGDGALELALNVRSASGEWTVVHALNGDNIESGLAEVLRAGCG